MLPFIRCSLMPALGLLLLPLELATGQVAGEAAYAKIEITNHTKEDIEIQYGVGKELKDKLIKAETAKVPVTVKISEADAKPKITIRFNRKRKGAGGGPEDIREVQVPAERVANEKAPVGKAYHYHFERTKSGQTINLFFD
jgi:hypothetical protein